MLVEPQCWAIPCFRARRSRHRLPLGCDNKGAARRISSLLRRRRPPKTPWSLLADGDVWARIWRVLAQRVLAALPYTKGKAIPNPNTSLLAWSMKARDWAMRPQIALLSVAALR
eukprot:2985185-Alexandrium_andersonii.AAC.1